MPHPVTRLNPATLFDSTETGYSQISIVEPGRMAHVSGQVAWRADGSPVPDDIAAQTRIVADCLQAALEALDATPDDIVAVRCFVVDLTPERLAAAAPILMASFAGAMPCLTGIGVAALAAPELQVEVEMTVRLPDRD